MSAANIMAILNPIVCTKCGNIVHALVRSKEELDSYVCSFCPEDINSNTKEEIKELSSEILYE